MDRMSAGGEIDIQVEVRFIERESDPAGRRFVFAYTITITNTRQPNRRSC